MFFLQRLSRKKIETKLFARVVLRFPKGSLRQMKSKIRSSLKAQGVVRKCVTYSRHYNQLRFHNNCFKWFVKQITQRSPAG